MFQLSEKEADLLVSQSVIPSKQSLGGYLPYVFTQEGVAMLSSVLRSKRAIQVNVAIMRAFVRLRQLLESNEELNRKFAAVIRKLGEHDKYFKESLRNSISSQSASHTASSNRLYERLR
jgi:ORF6N domain